MIKRIIIIIFLIRAIDIQAQIINETLVSKFSVSTINRLSDICNKNSIGIDKQISIGEIFEKEDSAVCLGIKNGITYSEVQAIRNSSKERIRTILSPEEWSNYMSSTNMLTSVENYAKQMTRYYLKKYRLDSIKYYQELYNHQKYQALLLLPMGSSIEMNEKLVEKLARMYDSDINKMLYEHEGLFIYNALEDTLQKIKPLSKSESSALRIAFLNKCRLYKHRGYEDQFINAMRDVIKDTIYYAAWFKVDIAHQAENRTKKEVVRLMKKVNLTKEAWINVRKLVYDKNRREVTLDFTYNKYTLAKDSIINCNNLMYDSLIAIEMIKDGEFEHISLLSTAIKSRKELKLRPTLTDTLIACTIELNRKWSDFQIKNPWGKFDFAKYESPKLDSLLNEQQYWQLLKIKNAWQAEEWAKNDWEEIKQRGISSGVDSAHAISSMKNYNINMLIIKDKYANNKERMNNELTALNATIPNILQRLKRARVVAAPNATNGKNGDTEKNQPLKNNFRW